MISFVGAGPGAADLLTLRAAERLRAADVVVWASSLVPPEVLAHCRDGVEVHDSARMTLDDVLAVFAAHPEAAIVRLHSGDPGIYSAVAEQVAWCTQQGRDFEIVPGVTAASATAAAVGRELTVPGLAQSVVLTRLAHRTAGSVPPGESVTDLARSGATLCVYLSAGRPEALQAALLGDGSVFDVDTPVVLGHRVSWPDERFVTTTVGRLVEALADLGATTGVMVLVGAALADASPPVASHVYSPDFTTSFRTTGPRTTGPRTTGSRPGP